MLSTQGSFKKNCRFLIHSILLLFLVSPENAKADKIFSYVNPQAPKGGTIRLHTLKKFDSFLPYDTQGISAEGNELLFATLTKTPFTNLSQSFLYVAQRTIPNTDFSGITFAINPKAIFEDGTPITAEDVKFSYELIRARSPTHKMMFENVKSVDILSTQEIKFSFKFPSASFIKVIGGFPIFSKADYEKNFSSSKFFVPLSSGPYKVGRFQKPHSVTYERVKNWWGETLPVNKGFYNFDSIEYTYYANVPVAFEAFKKGDLDWWVDIRIHNWMKNYDFPAAKDGRVQRIEFEKPFPHGLIALFFNSRHWPYDDVRVRKAVSILLDFEWLNKTYFHGQYKRLNSIFTNSGYGKEPPFHEEICQQTSSAELTMRARKKCALELLKEAGFTIHKKTAKLQHKKGPISLKLVVKGAGYGKIFQSYIKILQEIGIQASIIVADEATYVRKYENFDFDLILHYHPHILKPGEEQISFWSSEAAFTKGSPNLAGVHMSEVDDIVKKISQNPSDKKLKTYTAQLDELILSRHYVIPLWIPKSVNVAFWNHLKHPESGAYNERQKAFLDTVPCKAKKNPAKCAKILSQIRKGAGLYSYITWWEGK